MDIENNENGFSQELIQTELPENSGSSEEIEKNSFKKDLKRICNAIGTALLAETAVVFLFNALIFLILLFDDKNQTIRSFISNPAVLHVQQIIIASISFTLPVIFVLYLFGYKANEIVFFEKPQKKSFLPLFLIGISFCGFANIATAVAGSFFEGFGIQYEVYDYENPQGVFGFLLVFLSTVAVPALAEEFLYRGLILGLLKRFGEGFALISSSLLFGIMHGNFEQIPFAFLVGLVLGYAAIKSGSILTAVAIHAFNNLIPLVLDYFFSGISAEATNTFYNLYLIAILLVGIITLLLLPKDKTEYFEFKEATQICEKQKYKLFFTAIPIIVFIVLNILNSLKFFI